MLDAKEIRKIKFLRQHGYSMPEISKACSVPKSTVHRHVSDVKILPKYYARWLDRRNASKVISQRNWDVAKQKAEQRIHKLSDKELALFVAALYWGEGTKMELGFSNTDSEMIHVFLTILRKVFGVKDEDIKISIRIYEDLILNDCIRHWSAVTGINLKNRVSINILKGKKKGKLQFGMCRIRVRKSGKLHKEIIALIQRVVALIKSP